MDKILHILDLEEFNLQDSSRMHLEAERQRLIEMGEYICSFLNQNQYPPKGSVLAQDVDTLKQKLKLVIFKLEIIGLADEMSFLRSYSIRSLDERLCNLTEHERSKLANAFVKPTWLDSRLN